ncbi:hypothetical protein QDD76_000648 [Burkholderia cepacia]|nr:hypothetical protein [Burkholderia cepacia]EKS9818113.1 hypothetical protein [Burkholderia cepacia]EKS9847169.1 hypothetical protein [Burkholderia cepacia]EKS9859401.1 hypothetical protein [Burkholderia cepacia]EKS9869147.1 hypothetical protein [Burkholderia cepacia]
MRGQARAIGVQLRDMWAPAAVVAVKYQHAFALHNRAAGRQAVGRLSFPLQA